MVVTEGRNVDNGRKAQLQASQYSVLVLLFFVVGKIVLESTRVVRPLSKTFSDNSLWLPGVIEEAVTDSVGMLRAVLLYLPKESVEQNVKRGIQQYTFVSQTKWFLRSWEETCQYLGDGDRIDVLIVVTDDTVDKTEEFLERWNCRQTIRTDRSEPSSCRLIPGFVPVHERGENETLAKYKFANSIDAVMHSEGRNALKFYDLMLRSDLDTFLTPLFATWKPEQFVVGKGSFCFKQFDTCERLHNISEKMGWNPPNASEVVDNIGSTWYGDTQVMIDCSQLTMDVMRYLWEHEFNETERGPPGGWPRWHWGVLLLYAGNIAINHCTRDVGFEKRPDMLDFPSSSGQNIWKTSHLHTWQERNNPSFSKFSYQKGLYKDVVLADLDLNVTKEYATFMAVDGNREWNRTADTNLTQVRG